jgi:hypothetical protein
MRERSHVPRPRRNNPSRDLNENGFRVPRVATERQDPDAAKPPGTGKEKKANAKNPAAVALVALAV